MIEIPIQNKLPKRNKFQVYQTIIQQLKDNFCKYYYNHYNYSTHVPRKIHV